MKNTENILFALEEFECKNILCDCVEKIDRNKENSGK
jgi:hypothetical protein